jgi:hypothetical protein
MAESIFDTPELQSAQTASQQATQSAGDAAAAAFKMPDLLRQAVSERFKESPLTGQFGNAAQQFLTAVPQKRTELANLAQTGQAVMSPNQQQSILAGTRAANLVPLISLNDLLQSQFGKSDELVNAGTGAYNAYSTGLANAATLKRQNYEDVLNRLVKEQEDKQATAKLELDWFKARKEGSGGGVGSSLAAILAALNPQGVVQAAAGEGPRFSPQTGPGTGYEDDNGILWEYQADGTWKQVG